MRQLLLTLLLSSTSVLSVAQANYKRIADSLQYVTDMPYICESSLPYGHGCGSREFWRTVQQKEAILPFLIDKLTDTTSIEAYVPNFGGHYAVADVAWFALNEIILDPPTFELLGVAFDKKGCGFCSYYRHLRKDLRNRRKFQKAVSRWYEQVKPRLVWVESGQPFTGHHAGGMYQVK